MRQLNKDGINSSPLSFLPRCSSCASFTSGNKEPRHYDYLTASMYARTYVRTYIARRRTDSERWRCDKEIETRNHRDSIKRGRLRDSSRLVRYHRRHAANDSKRRSEWFLFAPYERDIRCDRVSWHFRFPLNAIIQTLYLLCMCTGY